MAFIIIKPQGRTPLAICLSGMLWVVAFLTIVLPAWASDDAYLEALDQEVSKVEGVSSDTAEDKAELVAPKVERRSTTAVPSREVFETQLRDRHVGTYSFYRRLPERSREEIFLDYSNGASMEALRSKIIERYLHP